MRFLLVDRVDEIKLGESIQGVKCWSLSNEIFEDHFQGAPIVPGVLLVESMAQLLGLLIEKSYYLDFPNQKEVYPILMLINKAKLREAVFPGDQCIIKATLKSTDYQRASGTAEIYVDGELRAEASLTFVVVSKDDFPENKFFQRREEYLHIITRNTKELE